MHYAYDEEGQLVTVSNRAGEVTRRFGWQDGLMVSHQDHNGLLNEYRWQELDGLPRVVAYRNSAGEQLELYYDFAGGMRRVVRDDGRQALWQLDDDDNVAQFTDFDSRKSAFIYERGELCGVVLPGGAQRQSEWDRYGRLLSETDPPGTHHHLPVLPQQRPPVLGHLSGWQSGVSALGHSGAPDAAD
ncbi:Uncharacterized conserved protein [Klebsiella pneumoniae subsp. ozaenae]|uniref:Uncharacterized conserved protein n=1 Tax=Klebsiella pneumoniae subsp. ozaenae TaxID=574 RepID=A0A377Z6I4_KLEPO|nr:Uncharacterized conserved protein [Klebsiella pneumoniae subsp. ozaenae]